MAALLLPRARPFFAVSIGLGLTSLYATQATHRRRPLLCDTVSGATPITAVSESFKTYSKDAKTPVARNGRPNSAAYKQMSAGSMLGLLGGVAVNSFSRNLAFVFGLLVFTVQFMASRGYNVIPMSRIQNYVKGIDIRSAVQDNVAFKLSFGASFLLASFAHF